MAPPKKQIDMGIIARSLKQINDRLDIYDFTIQSVHKTLFHLTEKVDRQEAMVCALQTKVFGPERGPVVETCAGFSSTARLRYPKTDANDGNNISCISSIAIHPVSGESISELGHHVHLRRDEHPIHYHLDHLDRLSNCSTWTPTPVSHSHNAPTGRQEVIPHCHNGSTHPQQSPNIEMHAVAPHTRCIGTSDSTSLTTNTHVVKCQATQTTTPNIVANVFNTQSSQATVQRMLHCFTCGGGGGGEDTSHVVARHLRKGVSRVEDMVMQPLTVLTAMHCHGSKYVVGMAHAHATAVVISPLEHRALPVAEAAGIYYLVVPTIVNRHIGIDVLGVNQKHASAVSTTLPHIAPFHTSTVHRTGLHIVSSLRTAVPLLTAQ